MSIESDTGDAGTGVPNEMGDFYDERALAAHVAGGRTALMLRRKRQCTAGKGMKVLRPFVAEQTKG